MKQRALRAHCPAIVRPVAAIALSAAVFAAASGATPVENGGCSSDAFSIDGSSVRLELCVPAGDKSSAKTVVTEHFSIGAQAARSAAGAEGQGFERELPVERLPGAESSRAIDDVSLERLGLARTLHLTIAVRSGSVKLEHALLIPGAVSLK
jgi:hypothetical protein